MTEFNGSILAGLMQEDLSEGPFVDVRIIRKGLALFVQSMDRAKAMADAHARSLDEIDIQDEVTYTLAAARLRHAQVIRKQLGNLVKPVKDALNEATKSVREKEREALHELNFADAKLRAAVLAYEHRREATRKLNQAELQKQQTALDEDARMAEAEALAAEGREEEAMVFLADAGFAPPVVLASEPKAQGVSTVRRWKGRCNSVMSLAKAVVAGRAPLKMLKENQKALDAYARAAQESFDIEGCEAYCEEGVAVRSE